MKKCYLLVVIIVTACTSDHSVKPVDASLDSPIDADENGPNIVTVDLAGSEPPLFAVYRDGTRPWQSIDPAASSLVLHVHDDYQLLAVCGDATTGFETGIQASTFSDGAAVTLPCFMLAADTTPTVTVTGAMMQPGSVTIGGITRSGTTANWTFSITTLKGMHTLLAMGAGKAIVKRALDLEANTTLPTIDVSAGDALMSLTFTANNTAQGATLESRLSESIGDDFMFLPAVHSATAEVLPASLLQSTDSQRITVFASTATSFQTASEAIDAQLATTIDLIPPLAGVSFVTGKASWSEALPAGDLELWAFSTNTFNFMHLTPTASWLGGKTELAMATSDVPGYRPEWVTDLSPPALAFDVMRTDGGVFLDTEAFEPLSLAPLRAKALHRRHRGSSLRR